METGIHTSAPGRICLFGDHQDYLGLPVIATVINRKIHVSGTVNGSEILNISQPDIDQMDTLDINKAETGIEEGDYLRLVFNLLFKKGIRVGNGYDIVISGNIPINAGLSSSSAFSVAWIKFLLKAAGQITYDPKELALLAYEAEVLEQGSSGGKMDQFTIAHQGTIHLDTETDKITRLNDLNCALVVANSAERKDTLGTLAMAKNGAMKALENIRQKYSMMRWKDIVKGENDYLRNYVSDENLPYFDAGIANYRITAKAFKEMQRKSPNLEYLGDLMNQHHFYLKNHIKNTTPKIDLMIQTAMEAGALGAKIVGSGGGGCIVAMTEMDRSDRLIGELKNLNFGEVFLANSEI